MKKELPWTDENLQTFKTKDNHYDKRLYLDLTKLIKQTTDTNIACETVLPQNNQHLWRKQKELHQRIEEDLTEEQQNQNDDVQTTCIQNDSKYCCLDKSLTKNVTRKLKIVNDDITAKKRPYDYEQNDKSKTRKTEDMTNQKSTNVKQNKNRSIPNSDKIDRHKIA